MTTDRYVEPALVGRGEMGSVWRYRDTELERKVAIKFVENHEHPTQVLAQARALAKCDSRHVVAVYAVEMLPHPDTGVLQPALVLEFLDGSTLAETFGGPIGLNAARGYANDIIAALEEFWAIGIAHGDLHAGNVIITKHGAKVLDPLYSLVFATEFSSLTQDRRRYRDLALCRETLVELFLHAEVDDVLRASGLKAIRKSATVRALSLAVSGFGYPEASTSVPIEIQSETPSHSLPGANSGELSTESQTTTPTQLGELPRPQPNSSPTEQARSVAHTTSRPLTASTDFQAAMVPRPLAYDPQMHLDTHLHWEIAFNARFLEVDFSEWAPHFLRIMREWAPRSPVLAEFKLQPDDNRTPNVRTYSWRVDLAPFVNMHKSYVLKIGNTDQLRLSCATWTDSDIVVLRTEELLHSVALAAALYMSSLGRALAEHREKEPKLQATLSAVASQKMSLMDTGEHTIGGGMSMLQSAERWTVDCFAGDQWSAAPLDLATTLTRRLSGRAFAQFESESEIPRIATVNQPRVTRDVQTLLTFLATSN